VAGLSGIEWGECVVPPRRDPELEDWAARELGTRLDLVPYLAHTPWQVRALVSHAFERGLFVHLHQELAELVWLAVSQDNSCRYCYDTHRALLRLTGIPEARMRRLEEQGFTADLDLPTRRACDFGRRLSRCNPPPDAEDVAGLREAGLSDGAVREIAWVASYAVAGNRISTLPALPPEPHEDMPERWTVRLLAPLVARRVRGRFRRGRPETQAAESLEGPYAFVVRLFEGLPTARVTREGIDDALASPILPARTKWLVCAVVARALGCARSESEAKRLLAAEGLAGEEVEGILRHLASPKLDRVETLAVPFARETVWYQTAQIQRKARELAKQISPAEFMELAGMAGVANRLCRLGALADALSWA